MNMYSMLMSYKIVSSYIDIEGGGSKELMLSTEKGKREGK